MKAAKRGLMEKIKEPRKNRIYILVKSRIFGEDERTVVLFDHRACANLYCRKLPDERASEAEGIIDANVYSIVYIG